MNDKNKSGVLSRLADTLIGIGLGESVLRFSVLFLSTALIGAVIWLAHSIFAPSPETGATESAAIVEEGALPAQDFNAYSGVPRLAQVHTTIPSRPRQEIVKYTVVEGDTIFGIAQNFGLEPQTILWGNYYTLL
ncbi:MAG TPA: LysM peptidoglycan-binding domain-containing protein, partial [Anaerolineales bacterium]|nr:LysM peptidoglycan-binding domain-containing protein [Anaerolineales bacterium]